MQIITDFNAQPKTWYFRSAYCYVAP